MMVNSFYFPNEIWLSLQVSRKMASDAMYKLEHGVDDKVKSKELDPIIEQLEEFQSSRWHDDYASNRALRDSMRVRFKDGLYC